MNRAVFSEVFLHPGDFRFAPAPTKLGTLLGSCVAITIWHPFRRFGGMCHIVLPGRDPSRVSSLDPRYADEAAEQFAIEIGRRNLAPSSFQVKLFGGGRMFGEEQPNGAGVGRRNVAAAQRALRERGLVVTQEHVGGTDRRRIHFDLSTGAIWMATSGRQPELVESAA